jgi:hypothetical protein
MMNSNGIFWKYDNYNDICSINPSYFVGWTSTMDAKWDMNVDEHEHNIAYHCPYGSHSTNYQVYGICSPILRFGLYAP